ncbi:hypothetical protein WEU38_10970 [Cyanobacterium aponinum AL20118]|uniref:Uncharacterized protein n=1 Tax=Cyanobacterium aponinum AL20115 TaxID=3090662 RepID=A0AAF0Z8F7_9CHRO|nr:MULTISPECIES: hypothetical protein [Cyanobacterium]WPF87333.1 hypothetical protein SAY89_11000 [Cyanobacterium aponinum AL20115]WVL00478.1 hypothetical protein Dongsha4_17800 [Cyanobacterium sp. Dongsha4]
MEYLKWEKEVNQRLSKYFSERILNKYNSSYKHLFNNNQTPQEASDYLHEYINDSEDAQGEFWFDMIDFD